MANKMAYSDATDLPSLDWGDGFSDAPLDGYTDAPDGRSGGGTGAGGSSAEVLEVPQYRDNATQSDGYTDAPDGGRGGGNGAGGSSAKVLEVPQYRDNPTPDAGAYEEIAPQYVGSVGGKSPARVCGRVSHGKLIVGACLVAAMAIGYAVGEFAHSKSGNSAGVRGSPKYVNQPSLGSTCEDDASFVHSNGKSCASFVANVGRVPLLAGRCIQVTGQLGDNDEQFLVKDFCRLSCGICEGGSGGEMGKDDLVAEINVEMNEVEEVKPAPAPVPAPPAPAKPEHTLALPKPSDECKDDETYVHSNGKNCHTFIEGVGRWALHDSRCNQGTGNFDENGVELLLHHYCRKSCSYCTPEDAAAADAVHAEHMKQDAEYKAAAEQAAASKAEHPDIEASDEAVAEKTSAEKAAVEQVAAEQAAVEQAVAEQAETEQAAAEQVGAEQAAAEQMAAEKAVADAKQALEQAEAKQAAIEQVAAEQAASEQAEAEQVAAELAESEQAAALQQPSFRSTCEDDASFVHSNGKSCASFVANVGRVPLLAGRCIQVTGQLGDNDEQFLVKDFCRLSCGICEGGSSGDEQAATEQAATEEAAVTVATVEENQEGDNSSEEMEELDMAGEDTVSEQASPAVNTEGPPPSDMEDEVNVLSGEVVPIVIFPKEEPP
mmetsp:Transcript_1276/g.3188  ORF Transcript_1276/g.3188 Transcript_1276/m.3188 type:complete len:660 (+) Transcript_1276:209-2188(+)